MVENQTVAAQPETVPPPVQLLRLLSGFQITAALYVAAELGLADLVADGPRAADDLAQATETQPAALRRLLRTLASFGVFTEVEPGVYGSTPIADTLWSESPGSMRAMVRLWGSEHYRAFGDLLWSVQTGKPAFDHVYGDTWWNHLESHPDSAAIFNEAMGNLARQVHAAAIEAYDLAGVKRLVDVGSGHGALVASILARYPEMRATLFDLPHVIEGAGALLSEAGVRDRCDLVAGDFFQPLAAGGDAYVLSMIIHDWDDDRAVEILRRVREAIAPDGKVLIVDAVLPAGDAPHFGKILDLTMLGMLGGQERTEAEFAALLARAGFKLTRVVSTHSPMSVVEGVPFSS